MANVPPLVIRVYAENRKWLADASASPGNGALRPYCVFRHHNPIQGDEGPSAALRSAPVGLLS